MRLTAVPRVRFVIEQTGCLPSAECLPANCGDPAKDQANGPNGNVERFLDAAGTAGATAEAGSYVIADGQTGQFIGTLRLDRRTAGRPGHVADGGLELELSYVLRRGAWGAGLAFEAAAAALRAATGELPDQPVLVVTQAANDRSRKLARRLGFQEVSEFEEFDARQVLAAAPLGSFRAP